MMKTLPMICIALVITVIILGFCLGALLLAQGAIPDFSSLIGGR